MKMRIRPYLLSEKSRDDLIRYISNNDFYHINRIFRASYELSSDDLAILDEEDGIFVILSSALICLYKLNNNEPSVFQLSDSPPTIIFRPDGKDHIIVELNSYGKTISAERHQRAQVLSLLLSTANDCRDAIDQLRHFSTPELSNILDNMNPDYRNLLNLI